nr:hypothetical protein [Tanacetum cinerariifolium]
MMIRKDPKAATKKVLAPFFYGFEDCSDSDTKGISGDVERLIKIGKGEGHELGHGVFQGIKGSGCPLVPCKRGFFEEMARLKDRRASPEIHSARRLSGMLSCEYRPELINSGYRKAVTDCDDIEGLIVYTKAPMRITVRFDINWVGIMEKWDSMVVRARGWEAMWWIKKCFILVEQGTDCEIVVLYGIGWGWGRRLMVVYQVNLGMEKSATMVPNDPNQTSPRIMSAPATRRTKRGTLKLNLFISSGVLEKRLLHSRNWPFSTITGKGVMGAGLEASRAAMRGWMMLNVLPQSTRTGVWLSVGSVLSRSKNSEAGSGSVSAGCSLSEISESLVKGSVRRGFGVGSKAVIAGVEFGFAVRAWACWRDVGWWMAISFWISARRPEMKQFRRNIFGGRGRVCGGGGGGGGEGGVAVGLGGGVSGGYQILCLMRLFGLVNLLVDRRLMCLYGEAL